MRCVDSRCSGSPEAMAGDTATVLADADAAREIDAHGTFVEITMQRATDFVRTFFIGTVSAPTIHAMFVLVCAAQVAWSHLWMRTLRFGPMEWLWRAITYRTLPAMRA